MQYSNLTKKIIALDRLTGVGKHLTRKIIDSVDNPREALFMDLVIQGVKLGVFHKRQPIGDFIDAYKYAVEVLEQCSELGISIINFWSPEYPDALRFEGSPTLIYYKGDLSCLNNPKRAAVIGTRNPDDAGREFAYQTGKMLADNGYTVISGLAEGCDTAGHTGCLDAGGKTAAFVPSNLYQIVPKKNSALAQRILDNGGLLISEYSPLTTPQAGMYITRDLLQAGSSNQIIVSEFAEQSGTLQTLQYASSFGKPIYTLKSLVDREGFNGHHALRSLRISCSAVDWKELEKLFAQ